MTVITFTELELDHCLITALDKKNINQPTAIQALTIPAAMDGRDIMGSSPTGTGKTLAYLLPILQYLLDFPRKKPGSPRVLILAPTRELAMQVANQACILTENTSLKIATITGGVSYVNHATIFNTTQDIVIATTGRLLQYIKEENFDCRAIELLVLDEADRMLDMGFAQDVEIIAAETRWRKQTYLFSATLEGEAIESFAQRLLNDPYRINADPSRRERKKITQYYYIADNLQHKTELLAHLLTHSLENKFIVFIKKKERLHDIAKKLQEQQLKITSLEGDMAQVHRNRALTLFEQNKIKILLATDVAARGIDIPDITHVINFDLPRSGDTYLHRIGRTGRAGRKGCAISLVEPHDFSLFEKIVRYTNEQIKKRTIPELPAKNKNIVTIDNKKNKKKLTKQEKTSEKKKKKNKLRYRDTKNIGKRRKPSLPLTNIDT